MEEKVVISFLRVKSKASGGYMEFAVISYTVQLKKNKLIQNKYKMDK